MPDVTTYGDDAKLKQKKFVQDFKPRPDITAYGDDTRLKEKKFVEDFEPRPDITAYGDDADAQLKEKKSANTFEPYLVVRSNGEERQQRGVTALCDVFEFYDESKTWFSKACVSRPRRRL
ncbi:hypothetical protein NL676_038556 [Syzygium grande]|nr:hypothetical protein NL676_038556 [Syzygium grande]